VAPQINLFVLDKAFIMLYQGLFAFERKIGNVSDEKQSPKRQAGTYFSMADVESVHLSCQKNKFWRVYAAKAVRYHEKRRQRSLELSE